MVLSAALLGHGCTVGDVPADEYTDPAWQESSGGIDFAAEVEDPAASEDLTNPPDATDDTDDLAEVDDVATDIEQAVTAAAAVSAGHYQNPVASNCADPGVIRVDAADGPTFWAACTGNGFPLFKSRDLVHWSPAGHIFHLANKPAWGGGNWWAPEIHHVGAGFVAYFVALSPSRHKMCIGAARAATIDGTWTDLGHPLVCDPHVGLIDPDMHTSSDGRHILYYKTDGNGLTPQERTIIYGQELTADGVHVTGGRHRLIQNTLAWEGDVVEAPWVEHRGNYYYLFYSGFRYCNDTYGVGVARARSPLGPFHKRSAPILHSNSRWIGPGHNSVVSAAGHDFIVYHAWSGAHSCGEGGDRELLVDRISWHGGWPFINNGTPSRGVHTAPLLQ